MAARPVPTLETCPTAYRIVTVDEWAAAQAAGSYAGNALDSKDSFMHMSMANEVVRTASRYFAGRSDLIVLEVDLTHASLADAKIEFDYVEVRDAFFPHIYPNEKRPSYALPVAAVRGAHALTPTGPDTFTGFPAACA